MSILTEDDLVNIKHTVLTLERQEIARNIDPNRFFGHLRAKYVFDERDCDEIRAVSSRVGSAEVFVDTLKRKGGKGYDEFCNALMNDKTQLFLLQRLTQTLELLRAKVIERKTEKSLKNEQQWSLAQQAPSIHHPPSLAQQRLLAQQAPLLTQQGPLLAQQAPSLPQQRSLPQQVPTFGGRQFSHSSQQPHPLHCQQLQQNLYSSSLPTSFPSGNYKGFQQSSFNHYHQPTAGPPIVTASRNSVPLNNLFTGLLPPQSESHNPQPIHKPLRKVQSRQTEKDCHQQEEGAGMLRPPTHYPPPPPAPIYSGEAPQGQDVYGPAVQQSNHFTIQPQQFSSSHQAGVVSVQSRPYYSGEQVGSATTRSCYPQDYVFNPLKEQITYSGSNPAVLPGMFTRGLGEGFTSDDSQVGGCGREEINAEYRTCNHVILARGSDVSLHVVEK